MIFKKMVLHYCFHTSADIESGVSDQQKGGRGGENGGVIAGIVFGIVFILVVALLGFFLFRYVQGNGVDTVEAFIFVGIKFHDLLQKDISCKNLYLYVPIKYSAL